MILTSFATRAAYYEATSRKEEEELTRPNVSDGQDQPEALGQFLPIQQVGQGKSILIYGPTLSSSSRNEQNLASAAGYSVTVVDEAAWSAMTTDQFAQYDAIVFPDPTCSGSTQALAAAEANNAVWSAAITGPIYLQGTDPVYHGNSAAQQLIISGINFAASGSGTGLYVSLSCYYYAASPDTPVPLLSALGNFQVVGQGNCPNQVTILEPTHPAMSGLTNEGLSNWFCSAHQFFTSYPPSFIPLAQAMRDPETALPFIIATRTASCLEFSQLLCAQFTVTFNVTAESQVTSVRCLGPCLS